MQLAEVFRLGIVVPLTDETNFQLKAGDINGLVEVKLLSLNQEDFYLIWESGLFEEMNVSLGLEISEYEDNRIEFQFLESCLTIVKKYFMDGKNEIIKSLLNKIYDILFFGASIKMPVYFFF